MAKNEDPVPISMVHVTREGDVVTMATQTVSVSTDITPNMPKKKLKINKSSETSQYYTEETQSTQATSTMTWPYPTLPSCSTCSKVFKNSSQLSQHMVVHSNVRKYKCTYCEKAFKQMSHLQQHTRMHTGEKPYKCKVEGCNRGFAQMANLHHHMRTHKDGEGGCVEKQDQSTGNWHSCDECDQMFSTTRGLACHKQRAHTKYDSTKGIQPALPQTKTKRKRNSSGKEGEKSQHFKEQHNEVSSSTQQTSDVDYMTMQKEKVTVSGVGGGCQEGMKLPTVATIVTPSASELPHIPASDVISALQQ